MQTYELNRHDFSPEAAAAADIVYFEPCAADLSECRDGWRAALLAAARRGVPVTAAVLQSSYGFIPAGGADGHDAGWYRVALCELLSYANFLLTDTYCAAQVIGMTEDEPQELLRALHTRFGLDAAVLTDLPLAFDGEHFTAGESGALYGGE